MGLPSKEENVLKLFLNEPTKHWHFKDIVREARISKQQANRWLKEFEKEKIVMHVKSKDKMPFFQSNFNHPNYKNKKKLFALHHLYKTGFLSYLQSLPKTKVIILFGSFMKSDWHTESDIDLFIYGDPEELSLAKYWRKLHRQIQHHIFPTSKSIKKIKSGLMKNVLEGYFVKGSINELLDVLQ
ncbi:nucleotidyltransferase domain-containing protein [Nanoarchaeota archaeon]